MSSPPREPPLQQHKARDRALMLPIIGLVALVSPFAAIFQLDVRIGGVPFTAVYLFCVWAALIGGAALLARQLRDDEHESDLSLVSGAERD